MDKLSKYIDNKETSLFARLLHDCGQNVLQILFLVTDIIITTIEYAHNLHFKAEIQAKHIIKTFFFIVISWLR